MHSGYFILDEYLMLMNVYVLLSNLFRLIKRHFNSKVFRMKCLENKRKLLNSILFLNNFSPSNIVSSNNLNDDAIVTNRLRSL